MKRVCWVVLAVVAPCAICQQTDESPEPARISRFPKELGRNFVTLFTKDNIAPLLVGGAASTAVIGADDTLVRYFERPGRWGNFDTVGRELGKSQFLGPAIGVSLLASRMTDNEEFQELSYSLAQGFIITNVITGGVKKASGRERPDDSSFNSFPSGHTSNSFTWATIAQRRYGWKIGAPAYAIAAYVGASRLQSRKHHLTDVLAGATLGYIVGRTVTRNRPNERRRRLQIGVTTPSGGGAALTLGIRIRR